MTADMPAAKATALRKPFPPESVGKLPKGGVMLDYVGHAAVTDRLLTVDPNWSWEPLALGPDGLPAYDRAGNLWIKLTICGVTRLGVGDGKNAKEVIGDAIRNAAMRFGVALDLWAKENLVEFAQARVDTVAELQRGAQAAANPDPTPITAKTRAQMFALFAQKGVSEEQQLPGINHITGKAYTSRADITETDAKEVIRVLKTRPDVSPQNPSPAGSPAPTMDPSERANGGSPVASRTRTGPAGEAPEEVPAGEDGGEAPKPAGTSTSRPRNMNRAQERGIVAALTHIGVDTTDPAEQNRILSTIIGRGIETSRSLTSDEATKLTKVLAGVETREQLTALLDEYEAAKQAEIARWNTGDRS